jgi:hypothetical protein
MGIAWIFSKSGAARKLAYKLRYKPCKNISAEFCASVSKDR